MVRSECLARGGAFVSMFADDVEFACVGRKFTKRVNVVFESRMENFEVMFFGTLYRCGCICGLMLRNCINNLILIMDG